MPDMELLAEEAMEAVSVIGDDSDSYTQEESAEFYENVANMVRTRAQAIREEMRG